MTGRGHFSIQALWKFVLWFKEQRYLVIHARPCGSTMGLEASVFSDPDLQVGYFLLSIDMGRRGFGLTIIMSGLDSA
jgi:hypothetical protein